ncbi:MAG TPA: hypothetical protein VFB99_06675 [Vicinamibacterales bacterium]|nr:hypothetical protein [Vicinamibacterales bacterium]
MSAKPVPTANPSCAASTGNPIRRRTGIASGADDLVIDNDGRVYAITAAGIEVLTEAGKPLGIIPVTCTPTGGRCQALAFGGADKRTLYVAGNGTLLRIQMMAKASRAEPSNGLHSKATLAIERPALGWCPLR